MFCVVDSAGRCDSSGTDSLREGQRILEVNGQSLLGATNEEAVKVLRTAGDRLNLLVCDGYELSSSTGTTICTVNHMFVLHSLIVQRPYSYLVAYHLNITIPDGYASKQ